MYKNYKIISTHLWSSDTYEFSSMVRYWHTHYTDYDGVIHELLRLYFYRKDKEFSHLIKGSRELDEFEHKEYYNINNSLRRMKIIPGEYFIIKKIKDGKEYDVDYSKLIKETIRRSKFHKFYYGAPHYYRKHNNRYWCHNYNNWKKNNKCRHQWEIHKNKHCDTYSYEKRNYDFI